MRAWELKPLPEFTGERIIPGLVDADLYNEHLARYEFAVRLVTGKRVLDAGCGSGYGSAILAARAASVNAIDSSSDAVVFAQQTFAVSNLYFQVGDCSALPAGPFDVIVAFEVIEHLPDWRLFLQEARRVLIPGGRFLVSTPNKTWYTASRGTAGENPFHVHEFDYEEFQQELTSVFPNVCMFLQNHLAGIGISPVNFRETDVDVKVASSTEVPEKAHFFLAVCSTEELPELAAFIWIPSTGNLLRERENHIQLQAGEIALKNAELAARNIEYEGLLQMFRETHRQLEENNSWAAKVSEESQARGVRILELQQELSHQQANFQITAAKFQAKVDELETTNIAKTKWAFEIERRLTHEIASQSEELGRCVQLLDRAEHTVTERTLWAQDVERQLDRLKAETAALRQGRWVKAGTKFGFVPE